MYRRAYWPNEGPRSSPKTYSPTPEEYKKAIDPGHVDRQGRTAVHLANMTDGDDDEQLKRVIKAGCDVNAKDKDGLQGIHYAAERGFARNIQLLAKHGAEVNSISRTGYSPLMLAARHDYPKAIRALVRAGANPNLENDKNEQAIHYAVCKGNVECIQDLIASKSKVNHANAEGATPLILATRFGRLDVMRLLVSASARLDRKDKLGRTALHWVAMVGSVDHAQLLIDAGAQLDTYDDNGQSPFVYCVQINNHTVLRCLMDAGCDSITVDGLNGTALALAALKGHQESVDVLLEKDKDPDEAGFFGLTPLMSASFESHVNIVKTLLDSGADPNIPGRMGATAITKCILCICEKNEKERHKIFAMLIRAGAEVNTRVHTAGYFTPLTNGRNCPLSFAMCSGYVSLMRMLLIAGSRVSCEDLREWSIRNNTHLLFDKPSLLKPVHEWKTQAKSLKHICRMVIRATLRSSGRRIAADIARLPIAPPLKQYVDFSDLEQMEPERAEIKHPDGKEFLGIQPMRAICCSALRAVEGTFLHQTVVQGQM